MKPRLVSVWYLLSCALAASSIFSSVQDPYAQPYSVNTHPGPADRLVACAVLISDENTTPSYHSPPPPCISTDFINHAFTEARLRYGLKRPVQYKNLEKHANEVELLAFVLLETSRAIAYQYSLDPHQVFELLPRLDVSQTDISKFCPVPIRTPTHKHCKLSPYRTLSGHCNNVYHPQWGAAFTPFQNFLSPHHPDGLSDPRGTGDALGHGLPSPRLVSQHIHHDTRIVHDHAITTMLIAWGQIIDHDITLTADTQDPRTFRTPQCCQAPSSPFEHVHHNCFPIEIPATDPFYGPESQGHGHGQSCMSFARSLAGLRPDCRLGTRKAYNRISSFLDANFVYGPSKKLSMELRTGKHGLLNSNRAFRELGLQDLLPLKVHEPDRECIRKDESQFCFQAGDIRVNEQLILTVLHTIFMREHNRIARRLGAINPYWGDERLFQETRRIVIAMVQHITFNEFLPMVLGKHTMEKHGLMLATKGNFWDGYNPHLDATASEEFVTSAFRFGHSLLPHKIERWSHGHHFVNSQDLHTLLRQPFDLYKPGKLDTYVLGLVNQLAQAMDEGVTVEVTNLLFKEPTQSFGMDLPAINIQRGREHGVPGYAYYRQFCDLPPIPDHWDGLLGLGVFRNETIYRYREIYASPHDIDLWSGGLSEIPQHDSLLGPTFNCIIAKQFYLLRAGDRFWYENPNYPSSFKLDQLDEIRSVTLSRLLCDNTDDLKTVQLYSMVYPELITNPRVSCSGRIIPAMNLEKWRENVPEIFNANASLHHFQTHAREYEDDYNVFAVTGIAGHPKEPGTGVPTAAAAAPLIPLTDKHNSNYHSHSHDYVDNHYHHHQLQHQQSPPPSPGHQLDFNSIEPHEYPVSFNSYYHPYGSGGGVGLVEGLQLNGAGNYDYAKTQEYNHHYFPANHGLYNQNQHYDHHAAGVGPLPWPVGEDNYQYQPGNDIHGDNYDGLIESPAPPPFLNLNYAHEYPHSSYFPISPVLKPPAQPHHKGYRVPRPETPSDPHYPNVGLVNTTSGHPDYGIPGSAQRPIEVHELRDLLHQNQSRGKYVKGELAEVDINHNPKPAPSRKAKRRKFLPKPFPSSPFPGLSGIFSPNPGYLARQKFYLPRHLNLNLRHGYRG